MWEESDENTRPLRTGLTTGTCATACAVACAMRLLASDTRSTAVSVTLPKGKIVELDVDIEYADRQHARAKTIKDAGDDPDITHGATIFVELSLTDTSGVDFFAAEGVGTVTREGLHLAVGEPAINPTPRKMITDHLQYLSARHGYQGGFRICVGVMNGEALAHKTMNPRLGIIGGLSILGTSGIVRPFSCAAWIASIHQGMDVARANGIEHLAATTGNTSENAIRAHYPLSDMALIEMGDFAGGVLKHLKKSPVNKLTICGGFGKITKLSHGHLDLNSRASAISFDFISELAASAGASKALQKKILAANTSIEALALCKVEQVDLANIVCRQALKQARMIAPDSVALEVIAIDRQGQFVGLASEFNGEGRA